VPWKETDVMELRKQFVRDVVTEVDGMMVLCRRYGISRPTGYAWLERYRAEGLADPMQGLWSADRSHEAHVVHNRMPEVVRQALLDLRLRHGWGARKLLHRLGLLHPQWQLPHESTVCELLRREGLVEVRVRRRAVGHPGRPVTVATHAGDSWSADFKGQFLLGNKRYCYPLTVTDNFSRYLLACQAMAGTLLEPTKAVFTRLFRQWGLPRTIRTDNGVPFAAVTLGRLSQLAVWWLKLGIVPELIEPGKPQQNGRHERMHRTLKAAATKPPKHDERAQQRRFNSYRAEFNNIRPHEALGMDVPAQWHQASTRRMPEKLLPMEYPDWFEARKVSSAGGIRWGRQWVNVTSVLQGEFVGLEPVDDGQWDVYFGLKRLGRLDDRTMRIEDELGRLKRCNRRPNAGADV
jgi:transposase InsO family protein